MLKKWILGTVIFIAGWFVYLQVQSWRSLDITEESAASGVDIRNQSPKEVSLKPDALDIDGKNLAAANQESDINPSSQSSSGENLIPEKDPASRYYLEEEEHHKLAENALFKGNAKDKLFEIRRKIIDSNYDAKKMSEGLAKKLNDAPDGKLSYEEFLSLMPKDIVADFEEMMRLVHKETK